MGQAASCWCLTMMSWGRMSGWGTNQSGWAGSGCAVQHRGMVWGSDLWLAAARQHSKCDSPMQTSDVGSVLLFHFSFHWSKKCTSKYGHGRSYDPITHVDAPCWELSSQSLFIWTQLLVILVVLLLGSTWPSEKYQISPCCSSLKYVGFRENRRLSHCSCSRHSNR